MGILYTISYKLMYLFFIVSITIYIVHHSNSTGLLNYLIYSSMILPMIGWYAPSKLLLKLCMYFILIITCNLISHIMIISNCFILIVISVKLPLCIMCTHLYTITRLLIIITSVCIIILHGSIFALSLLHIFYNLPLNYYQQLIVIALLLNLNNILFYTFLRWKMLIRFNILYLSCKYPIIDVLCYYCIFNSYIPTLTHLNVILHRLTHLERNLDLNPLTTNKYRCINQINQSIMVYPVSLQNATVINHVDNYDSEMLDMFPNDIIENDTIQGQMDDDKYDYSILGSIDPDTHYFPNQRNLELNNERSRWRIQIIGFPQRSVHSPMQFNIYTNDHPLHDADDLCVTAQYSSFTEVGRTIGDSLDKLTQYYRSSSLRANPDKTQVAAFHLRNKEAKRSLKVIWNKTALELPPT